MYFGTDRTRHPAQPIAKQLLRIIMMTVEDGIPKMLYDKYPILIVVIPAILLLSLLSILYGVKLFQDMVCWNREKRGRIVLEKQISSL